VSSTVALRRVARALVAPEHNHEPPRSRTLMAFGLQGVCDGFAAILKDEKTWLHLLRPCEPFQGCNAPEE